MSGPGPPLCAHSGSTDSSRVLVYGYEYESNVTFDPLLARIVNQGHEPPRPAGQRVVEVGDVDGYAAVPPDLDGLTERVLEVVAYRVAHVRDVDTPQGCHLPA